MDEYTGKKIVSPLDFASPEKAIINMLFAQGKTVKESADFLREIIHIIEAPAYKSVSDARACQSNCVIEHLRSFSASILSS